MTAPASGLQSPHLSTDTGGSASPSVELPPTAGFDFGAISRALGKDIDVDALKAPPAGPQSASLPVIEIKPLLERSESTPPAASQPPDSSAASHWAQSSSPPSSSPLATNSLHDLSRLSLDSAPLPSTPLSPAEDAWSSPADAAPEPAISYDTNAWGSSPSSLYRSATASSSAALPSFSSMHKQATRGFSHHLPPPDEPAMVFASSDGFISASARDDDDPWSKPLPRLTASTRSVLDNPWG